jgi:hypothetical protein
MGGDPMGGMGGPMGGSPVNVDSSEPLPIPQNADVWDVLDSILNNKTLDHEKELQQQKQKDQESESMPAAPPAPPMGQPSGFLS